MKVILASSNKNKIKEIKSILNDNIDLITLNDLNFKNEIKEDGSTLYENALIKSKTLYDIYKIPVISDDSGLFCEGISGLPGVNSHRFASLNPTDLENNLFLINKLKNVENKNAYFKCVICYYDSEPLFFEGVLNGKIILEMKGNNGFGYDPLFYLEEYNKTLAELTSDDKNIISHRYKALKKLGVYINELSSNF